MKLTLKSILIIILVLVVASMVFFIYTVKSSSPTIMALHIPKDENVTYNEQNSPSKLTLILLKNDMAFSYFGSDIKNGKSVKLKEVRTIILEGTEKFTKDSLIVIIKPGSEATYRNTVDILDEMAINKIRRYEMTDLNKEEKEFLAKVD
jgi:hypothetical protein